MKQRATLRGCNPYVVAPMNHKNETDSKPGKTSGNMVGTFESTWLVRICNPDLFNGKLGITGRVENRVENIWFSWRCLYLYNTIVFSNHLKK